MSMGPTKVRATSRLPVGLADRTSTMPDSWDAVLTCFFIDTARNIVEYLETIYRILKRGGVWINCGALLSPPLSQSILTLADYRTNTLAF